MLVVSVIALLILFFLKPGFSWSRLPAIASPTISSVAPSPYILVVVHQLHAEIDVGTQRGDLVDAERGALTIFQVPLVVAGHKAGNLALKN